MTTTINGLCADHLDVTDRTVVTGVLVAGATVHDGAQLVVNGTLSGDVIAERGAEVMAVGLVDARFGRFEGTLSLYGTVRSDLPSTGRVMVGIDSTLTRGDQTFRLGSDGALVPTGGDHDSPGPAVGVVCDLDPATGTFDPFPLLSGAADPGS